MIIPTSGKNTQYGSNFQKVQAPPAFMAPRPAPAAPRTSAPRTSAPVSRPSRPATSAPHVSASPSPSPHSRTTSSSGSSGRISPSVSTSVPKTNPNPVAPSVASYLQGDTTYLSQLAQLKKAYQQYLATQNNNATQYQNQYNLGLKSLGQDRTNSFQGLMDDYASRGLLNSGVYAKAYSDLQTDYNARQTQLDTQRQSFLADQATNLSNFKGDQTTSMTTAKQDAIARRAAKYGA